MQSLQDHFLLAMPSLDDSFFNRSLIYICEHNDQGAMGLVVNIPVNLSLKSLLEQVEMEQSAAINDSVDMEQIVFQGGPIAQERGFVLHSPKEGFNSSLSLNKQLMVTTSKDVLQTLGTFDQPEHYIVALGYSGWEAGQLEQEIIDNAWLTLPASADLIFKEPVHKRWESAAQLLGVDVWQLSSQVGHA
ncbi:YqgE/AlgH family protein [Alginatibacterium sediminis]|uniref:UPF0301 protein DBZ36_10775 n=1 Tax=Alginatibacterium sediminis TaxID=2164068 RepID=A0A420EE22_9ALTE|nr:YqgE/AlgH family protein [Alginatibacterium sediminis]RKF18904.1 YqgE/AlgH family protein [Alginatibacterium sediminis]